ncbi:ABC transporter ATP-binding protein [Streptomyces canus]|uniref:ABC transporter ATP-binding protein n=1 Tax=Streptomyces canus TaxID=58343 RepID=UPI0038289C21
MSTPVVKLQNLQLSVVGPDGDLPILRDVELEVARGETIGLVGESGSGKSMTLRAIAGMTPPASRLAGHIEVDGVDVLGLSGRALREIRRSKLGFVFQDPRAAVNPLRRVQDLFLEDFAGPRSGRGAHLAAATQLLAEMGVNDPECRLRQFPFELSGGLLQRVLIASVLIKEPEVLLADEPTTALDVTSQSDVLALTQTLRERRSTAMVFVTHDLDLAVAVCDRILVMYAGRVVETLDDAGRASNARHPYTRGLLACRPEIRRRLTPLPVIPGNPARAADTARGCPFRSRCPIAIDRCIDELPDADQYPDGWVRCHRHQDVADGTADALAGTLDTAQGA